MGLHFGHDAAATVLRGGKIQSYVMCERFSRIKHQLGLDIDTIYRALTDAGIGVRDLDCVAVSSTQGIELLVDTPSRFDVEYRGEDYFGRPVPSRFEGLEHAQIAASGERSLLKMLSDPELSGTYVGQFFAEVAPAYLGSIPHADRGIPWLDFYSGEAEWESAVGLTGLAGIPTEPGDQLRYGFHVPLTATLDGVQIPGYAVHHHLAHAACSYYQSGFRQAAVFTHDGFGLAEERVRDKGFLERACGPGMFFLGEERALYPLMPHKLGIGFLYEHVATEIGLGVSGGPGKLMGLAAYGKPRFFDESFVGNLHDLEKKYTDAPNDWIRSCLEQAGRLGYDLTALGDPNRITEPVNADIAASTQLLLERTRLAAVASLKDLLNRMGREDISQLCMSGGTALNCPSNTDIAATGEFDRVFIEPMCDDSGIAVGAALAVHHSILGNPLPESRKFRSSPYLGPGYPEEEISAALAAADDRIRVELCSDTAESAARDLADNRIVAWFEGKSEAGPRALGHRSLLADPRPRDNWARVNRVKGREWWRPLAPAVLGTHAAEWFTGTTFPSPYMLFNADVCGNGLGAVTHVDGTARIQTVDEACGDYFRLITAFHRLTGTPVVLNTSLNSPGEPIVEHPADAVSFFLDREADVLYLPGYRLTRKADNKT
ncbi:carbamoyltransferase C-terminal domain-containing protein [Streptomyces sp. NPDC059853]|uniref:carbamoyltransferase C-terminal domain-containing protein n=1 Tax=Streptomyces sp. NPDC059853 TaxID=3346973 RepID=UPI003651021F